MASKLCPKCNTLVGFDGLWLMYCPKCGYDVYKDKNLPTDDSETPTKGIYNLLETLDSFPDWKNIGDAWSNKREQEEKARLERCNECLYCDKCVHSKEDCERIWETVMSKLIKASSDAELEENARRLGVEVLQELCPKCGYYVCRCKKEEEAFRDSTCLHCGAKKLSDGYCPKCNRAWQFDKCKCGGYKPIDEELCSACKEKDMDEYKEEKYAYYDVKGMNQEQLLALSVYIEAVLNRKKIEEQLQQALNWEKSKKQDLDETMKK